eukprot:TRINITY_DN1155_c0_g1_i2.p1 TRINITY_DN1155_c0_g1~~TRINITY_DN1155_c0_g1_i2.p1  ORF type:complete len:661 (-),score=149.99 TRINITY_DN1155_c0_g1_i2:198-2180(-)
MVSFSKIATTVARQGVSRLSPAVRPGSALRSANRCLSTAPRHFDQQTDVLVVGCGIAGCSAALRAAEAGLQVTMLSSSKQPLDSNSYWAQGGIIYKGRDGEDTPAMLEEDIKYAGAGKCADDAVTHLAKEGPRRVDELLLGGFGSPGSANVPFDRDTNGELKVCLEASHSAPRIIHWRDHTGRAITEEMVKTVLQHPSIKVLTSMTAVDAIVHEDGRCLGMLALNTAEGVQQLLGAHSTVLATGGLGALYTNTSNPASARGDGVAIASRAGASLSNLEFVQFHPTTLYRSKEQRVEDAVTLAAAKSEDDVVLELPQSFLLTEAMRGYGAILRNPVTLHAFAKDYHKLGELAPRDVVTRMIWSEMKKAGTDYVLLDPSASGQTSEAIKERFPSIHAHCSKLDIDIGATPGFPVVPAQHYSCGGVLVDLEGRTSVPGLYAAGEVACTGLHGANRLASTSLLEGLTWGAGAGEAIVEEASGWQPSTTSCGKRALLVSKVLHEVGLVSSRTELTCQRLRMLQTICAEVRAGANDRVQEVAQVATAQDAPSSGRTAEQLWSRLQAVMWQDVGIIRTPQGLEGACGELGLLAGEAEALYAANPTDPQVIQVRNGASTALAVARSAAANPVSRGAHYIESKEAAEAAAPSASPLQPSESAETVFAQQ